MTANLYEVPLIASSQSLSVTLGGVQYGLVVKWNSFSQCWVLDIYDAKSNPLVCGIAMTTGVDLLSQFSYLNFGGALFVVTDNNTFEMPTFFNLGSTSHLYFLVVG